MVMSHRGNWPVSALKVVAVLGLTPIRPQKGLDEGGPSPLMHVVNPVTFYDSGSKTYMKARQVFSCRASSPLASPWGAAE